MSTSLKAVVQLALILVAIAAGAFWALPDRPDGIIWTLRIALPLVAILLGWLLWRDSRRKDLVPDFLRELAPGYFERDGLCFTFVPRMSFGIWWLDVYFQNRYDKLCETRIILQAPRKSFWFGRLPLPGIDVSVCCDGGAFGVVKVPWPIPLSIQGKRVTCEIAAHTRYPQGSGKMLRFREGLRVGTPGSDVGRAAVTGGLLLVGVIRISRPASLTMQLPVGVAEAVPSGVHMTTEIIWRPDLPTHAFPVVMTAQGAAVPVQKQGLDTL